MSETKQNCNCDGKEKYQLNATGYILCLGCGNQTKNNGEK